MSDLSDWTIDFDRACATCGYNLRGLQPSGVCPECGSLFSGSLGNDALEWRDERWVAKLRGGCALILGGQIPLFVTFGRARDDLTNRLWAIGALALCAAGAWLVSSPARDLDRERTLRRLRLGVRLTCAAPVASAIAPYPVATALLWPPCIFFTFKLLAALASRRGAPSWAKFAGFVAWNLAGAMLLLGFTALLASSLGEVGGLYTAVCSLVVFGFWMIAAYAGALAVLIRFAVGLRRSDRAGAVPSAR